MGSFTTHSIIKLNMLLGFSTKIIKTLAWRSSVLLRFDKSGGAEAGEAEAAGGQQCGTEYSNWVLARSARGGHQELSYLRRREGRDRFSIHKLTNMEFMCSLASREDKYQLRLNEKIVLLAQMNHVCNVLKKDKALYAEFGKLAHGIAVGLQDPEDYVCAGTYLNALVDLGQLGEGIWEAVIDALLVRKYEEEYDQLFGVYAGLHKYRTIVEEVSDFFQLQRNRVLFNIPVVYRNSLETVRQFIRYNSYNLKECRILLRCLHHARINDSHFWSSGADWFNLYIKEQLAHKELEEFFILAESAVDRVLFDDGLIRPRSILEELSEIAFILSEHQYTSQRYISFIQQLIIHSIEHGSQLFLKYLDIQRAEAQSTHNADPQQQELNQHMRLRDSEEAELANMQKKYKTIFVNPTDLRSETIVQILIILKRIYEHARHSQQNKGKDEEGRSRYDQQRMHSLDMRVLNWLAVRLCQPKMKYTINELLKIIECRHILGALRVDIRTLVLQKVKDVRQKDCSLTDLRELFLFLPLIDYESISYILEHFLSRAHPKDILQLTQLFEMESMSPEDYEHYGDQGDSDSDNQTKNQQKEGLEDARMDRSHLAPKQKNKRWMPYLRSYFLQLPGAVNCHEKYYSFQENCYFLWLLLKNEEYWESGIDYIYLGEMEKLKHSIKISSYSRGFKLQMGTYFYKLMNYIDLVTFFDGGA